MNHVDTLKLLDKIMGVLFLLAGLIVLVVSIAPLLMIGGADTAAVVIATVGGLLGTVVAVVVGILHFKAASLIVQGRGKILQTVLALLNISNVPLDTCFAVYTLWVVWMNEETKNHFA